MPDATHRAREFEGNDRGRLIALLLGPWRASPSHNLPLQFSSSLGWEEEWPEIRRLPYDTRLLMLTGSGGGQADLRTHATERHGRERVCNRLDGLPLAIELAAARTKVLTGEEIAGPLVAAVVPVAGKDRE